MYLMLTARGETAKANVMMRAKKASSFFKTINLTNQD
jgi:hypothetical protein